MRLIIALIVWVAAAAGAVALSSAVSHSIKKPSTGSTAFTLTSGAGANTSGAGPTVDPSTVRSTDSVSLFRTANLGRALASAQKALSHGARVTNFALYPGYLSITAAQGNQEVNVDVQVGGRVIRTTSPATGDTSEAFPLSGADAGVPEALMARIASAAHIKPSALHYFVLMRDPTDPASHGGLRWFGYPQEGATRYEYFVASSAEGPIEAQASSGRVRLR